MSTSLWTWCFRGCRRWSLGGQGGQSAAVGALEGAPDAGVPGLQVEVGPVEAEEFALAQPGVEGELEQGVEAVAFGGLEELARFGSGKRFGALEPGCAGGAFRATLRGSSSSRTVCWSADLRTECT